MSVVAPSEKQDIAEAEVEGFREELGPFVVAAETTRMSMVFTDAKRPGNPIIFANNSFLKLTGYDREEVLGQGINFLMARITNAEALARVAAAFAGRSEGGSEIEYRCKDGRIFWSAIFVSPVTDKSGDIVQYFASFVDLTTHKLEQAQSTMLIDELNHRVKNTLATVQSIVSQALRQSSDASVIRASIESRLSALSRSHDLLTRENWGGAGLLDLVNEALEPFGVADGRAERFVITGQNIRLPANETLALGIALHELATNAVKYGALSNGSGSVVLGWTVRPDGESHRLLFQWSEEGGPPVSPPSRKGFGSRVIERGLAHELHGSTQLEYRVSGIVCTVDFPITDGSLVG